MPVPVPAQYPGSWRTCCKAPSAVEGGGDGLGLPHRESHLGDGEEDRSLLVALLVEHAHRLNANGNVNGNANGNGNISCNANGGVTWNGDVNGTSKGCTN